MKLHGSSGKPVAGAEGDTGAGSSRVLGTLLSSRTAAWQAGAGRCEAVEGLSFAEGALCRPAGRVVSKAGRGRGGFPLGEGDETVGSGQ